MPYFNPLDTTYSIIQETTAGTFPASGSLLRIDVIQGDTPMLMSDVIESATMKSSRASAGQRKVNLHPEGGLKVHFKRDAAIELLLVSALSANAWVEAGTIGVSGDTLKASNVDVNFSVEKKMTDSSGSAFYERFTGYQVSKFGLSVEASGNAEASFSFVGMNRTTANSATSLTYTAPSTQIGLAGIDLSSVSVAGLTGIECRSASLSVDMTKETRDVFGSVSPVSIGTTGNRKVALTLSFYRKDFTPETVCVPDTPIAVSFTIGSGTNGYTFLLPAAMASIPKDEENGSKQLVTVDFTAAYDATTATDFQITRL